MEQSHYYSASDYYRETFGSKVYRLAIDGGFTCPNRDGTLGTVGCYFCSSQGSGDFTPYALTGEKSITSQIESAKDLVKNKKPGAYMAYLQSFTNTYAPIKYLNDVYSTCLKNKDIAALSLGTRPDCISDEIVELLVNLRSQYSKPIYIELGLQTIHDKTEKYMGRGYSLSHFNEAFNKLSKAGLPVIVHLIIGLPGETTSDMLDSIKYISKIKPHGLKISLLNIISGTIMEGLYNNNPELFNLMNIEDYVKVLGQCINELDKSIVVYRLTGDAPKSILTAPLFVGDKKRVLNTITKYFKENNIYQGQALENGGNNAT